MKNLTMLAFAGLGVVSLAMACKSDPPKNPEPIYPNSDGGAYNPMYPQPDAGAPMMAPEAGAPEAASPIAAVFDAAAQALVEAKIKQMQPKVAPGMKPEGPIVGGMLQEGGVAEAQAMLMPGKCYTVIGTSPMGGITELDVQVSWVTLLPGLQPVIAIDGQTGPDAVVAASPNCYKIPPIVVIATPVKITVKATKGAGLAGAQLYAK